jgi:hypothetical protein
MAEAGENAYRTAMRLGSEALRDRILDFLARRAEREELVRQRNEAARRAIAAGWPKAEVVDRYSLSETAYEQLAGQVRAGAQ